MAKRSSEVVEYTVSSLVMRTNSTKLTPVLILLTALLVGILCVFGGNSYEKLQSIRQSLAAQRDRNSELRGVVGGLKSEINAIETDPRAIEKAARNELGMARPDDVVILFEKKAGQ